MSSRYRIPLARIEPLPDVARAAASLPGEIAAVVRNTEEDVEQPTKVSDSLNLGKYDADGDGKLNAAEFNALKAQVADIDARNQRLGGRRAESTRQARKVAKITLLVAVLMIVLLIFSFVGNWVLIDHLVHTETDGSNLVAKAVGPNGQPIPVRVAETRYSQSISSRLSAASFEDLKELQVMSATGAYVSIKIEGFMKLKAQPCRDPIVKFVTAVGTIILEGTDITFDSDLAPIFLASGLQTFGLAVGPGSDDRRRKLTPSSLKGFFTSLENIVESAPNTTCLPELPVAPTRWKGYSKRLDECTHHCVDKYGFVTKGYVGTEEVDGIVYKVRDIFSISNTVTLPDGTEASQFKRVSRFPRYPQVKLIQVNNGTHGMEWLEFKDDSFQCRLTDGWPEGTNPDPTDARPYDPNAAGSATITRITPPPGSPKAKFTYEGLTFYDSERHKHVESFKYRVEPIGDNDGIRLEYYTTATAAATTKPLGMHAFHKDKTGVGYKLVQRSDYYEHRVRNDPQGFHALTLPLTQPHRSRGPSPDPDHFPTDVTQVNAEVTDAEVAPANFELLNFEKCATRPTSPQTISCQSELCDCSCVRALLTSTSPQVGRPCACMHARANVCAWQVYHIRT